jgi:hypothetical protein
MKQAATTRHPAQRGDVSSTLAGIVAASVVIEAFTAVHAGTTCHVDCIHISEIIEL